MGIGKFNSSITRVRPVFQSLFETDSTGRTWLPKIWIGVSKKSLPPPEKFLGWLISNTERMDKVSMQKRNVSSSDSDSEKMRRNKLGYIDTD